MDGPSQKRLEEYEDRLLTVCHSRGLAIEVNTRFLYRDNPADLKKKYLEANARLIRKAKALGVGIAIGSDAHSPKDQGNGFDVALKMLDDAKVNEIVFPVGGRLARVALRATREHLEAQAKTRDTSVPGSSITGFGRAELGLPEQVEIPASARRESARAAREAAAAKRSSGPTRSGKRADAAAKSTSRRTPESSSSSGKAKAARTADPAPAKKKPLKTATPAQKSCGAGGKACRQTRESPPEGCETSRQVQKRAAGAQGGENPSAQRSRKKRPRPKAPAKKVTPAKRAMAKTAAKAKKHSTKAPAKKAARKAPKILEQGFGDKEKNNVSASLDA